jgi:hypothetical protein
MGRPRLRTLARFLRVVVACLVLGVLGGAARGAAREIDAVAWNAGAWVARTGDAARAEASAGCHALGTPSDARRGAGISPRARVASPPRVARRPPRARTIAVRRRVYLRNAALLC